MQLLLRRSARDDGWVWPSMTYLLDARLELSAEEQHIAERHHLLGQPVYDSDARIAFLEAAAEHAGHAGRPHEKWVWQTEWREELIDALSRSWSLLLSFGNEAMSVLELSMTYEDLIAGRHIECEELEPILIAEDAIHLASQLLAAQLDAVLTFDGSEVLIEH